MKLKILRIMAIITGLIGTTLFNRFIEGGALFMSLVLICLLSSIYFSVKSFLNLRTNIEISKKMLNNISNSGTLGLALGVMGAFIGLITAFDVLEATGAAETCYYSRRFESSIIITSFWAFHLFRFKVCNTSTSNYSKIK